MTRTRRGRPPGRAWAIFGACCVALAVLSTSQAWAHDVRPGVLSLAEAAPGTYELRFVPPVDSRGDPVELAIELPAGCVRDGDHVRCAGALAGVIAVRGMRDDSMRTVIRLERRDGTRSEWVVDAGAPAARVGGASARSGWAWLRIGIDHIVGGLDHLAFVLGLLLVLGLGRGPMLDRRLLGTITAFTVAHSLTLTLAIAGVTRLSADAVEACIALSVLLVAREAAHDEPTVTRRWPWLAAAGFGLIHGLGFAGALVELGLPRASVVSSLVWFNLGVELGQLAAVGFAVALVRVGGRALGHRAWVGRACRGAACHMLGGLAAWWLCERI